MSPIASSSSGLSRMIAEAAPKTTLPNTSVAAAKLAGFFEAETEKTGSAKYSS